MGYVDVQIEIMENLPLKVATQFLCGGKLLHSSYVGKVATQFLCGGKLLHSSYVGGNLLQFECRGFQGNIPELAFK